jgi:hypothetical protein
VFREIVGFIWLQITLFVVILRVVLSTFAAIWRFLLDAITICSQTQTILMSTDSTVRHASTSETSTIS